MAAAATPVAVAPPRPLAALLPLRAAPLPRLAVAITTAVAIVVVVIAAAISAAASNAAATAVAIVVAVDATPAVAIWPPLAAAVHSLKQSRPGAAANTTAAELRRLASEDRSQSLL